MGKRKRSGKNSGKKKYKYRKPEIKVHCSNCPAFINEKDTEFVDIEEDIQGCDVLTFICPKCGSKEKSRRFG